MMMSIDYNIQEVNYLLFDFIDIELLFQNWLIRSNIREAIFYFIDIELLFQNKCQKYNIQEVNYLLFDFIGIELFLQNRCHWLQH